MIAICDCNHFYPACHEYIETDLWDNVPVVVMGNNGEVVVALNPRAKAIGIHRGMLKFQNLPLFKQYGVRCFESNYELYDSFSENVMLTVADFVELFEVYSIDELFFSLTGYDRFGYEKYCKEIAGTVKRNTGIAVSIGVGMTKTLAKISNRFAKKYKRFNSVFVMDTEEKWRICLQKTIVKDVWGLGDGLDKRLNAKGIFTAWDFVTKIDQKEAKKLYSIELERTWLELNGISCYPITQEPPDKKTISTTRSFPKMIRERESLRQAVATYAAVCASNLRKQNSYAVSMKVFLRTNKHRKDLPQYKPSREIILPVSSNSTLTLVEYALKCVDDMYLEGFDFKKAGVEITKITKSVQASLFSPIEIEMKRNRISPVEDFNNYGFDRHLLSLGVEGFGDRRKIDLQVNQKQKNPLSRFNHILVFDCT